jgi:hypothetical protein
MKVNGVWVGWGLGDWSHNPDGSDHDPTVRKAKAFMRRVYASYAGILTDSNKFDQQMQDVVSQMQSRLVASGLLIPGRFFPGVLDLPTESAMGFKPAAPPPPNKVLFTVNGAAVDMWTGYQADIGRDLARRNLYFWQPIGYDSKPFPMVDGLNGGTAELENQILNVHPTGKFAICAYSEGAIIASNVYDKLRDPSNPISARRKDFLGAATFGNPRRQHGHSIPNGIDPGGQGIVVPNLMNTEQPWWDLANGKNTPGAMGDDLYTNMSGAVDGGSEAQEMRAIWGFVYNVWDGIVDLTTVLFSLLGNPIGLSFGAVQAIIAAITFFGTEHLAPHTDYQDSHPIVGDPRDSWRIALDYLASLAA